MAARRPLATITVRASTGVPRSGTRPERSCSAPAPAYFEAVEGERVIAAPTRKRHRARGLSRLLLVPNGSRDARRPAAAAATRTVGVLCAEHVGRPRDMDGGRTELRHLDRQPDRRRHRRRRAAAGARRAGRKRGPRPTDRRHGPRRVHRHRLGRTDRRRGTPRPRHVRLDARRSLGRSLAETIIPPAFREAHNARHAALSRNRRGAGGQPAPRADGAASRRAASSRSRSRSHRRCESRTGYFFGAFLRDISDRREHDDELRAPRSRPKRRPARRASSWPT